MDKKGLELGVGFFLLVGISCLAYLTFSLGGVSFLGRDQYELRAKFVNVAGLKERSSVTMAGVQIGTVKSVELKDCEALVTFSIDKAVRLEEDSVAGIKTMGIIGEKYVSITPGGSDVYLKAGETIRETRAAFDIESMLGKFVFGNMESPKGTADQGSKPDDLSPEPGRSGESPGK